MLDVAAVGPGTRVLDAGCGAGGASVLAAGRGAQVNGLDAAPTLLAIARARVPDGDFRRGDLTALPYADETFDAIIAANVLAYVEDTGAAVRELCRVCLGRGCVVLATWGGPEECAQHTIIQTLRALLPPASDDRLPLLGDALSAPGDLEALSTRASLRVRGTGSVSCPYEYPDREMLWQAQVAAGPLQAAARLVGAEALKTAVLRVVAPYQSETGAVRLPNRFRYVVATPHASNGATARRRWEEKEVGGCNEE